MAIQSALGDFPGSFAPEGMGETYGGTIHLRNSDTFENFINQPHWQNHEHGHILQGDGVATVTFLYAYLGAAEVGAIKQPSNPRDPKESWYEYGHAYNPLEVDADNVAYVLDLICK